MQRPVKCKGPAGITRRNMLQIGTIGALTLPQVLQASERLSRNGVAPKADSCILVFLNGGPSHLDMWDMKPDQPSGIRGEFQPIATSLPTVQVCEHLPRLAKLMAHCTLVRSVHHNVEAHGPAVYHTLTGVTSRSGEAKRSDHPAIGSVLGVHRPAKSSHLSYVLMPYLTFEVHGPQPGYLGGWMGPTHDPLLVLSSGKGDGLAIPGQSLRPGISTERIQERKALLDQLSGAGQAVRGGEARAMENLQARACDLLTSPAAQEAFQLDREPMRLREAYGRNIYGQSLLLARRLVEAGARLACISWSPAANGTWDTHVGNFTNLKNGLLPSFDAGISALLTDLLDRSLLERTLVVVMGEVGRTPRINDRDGGRDHWGNCYTVLFAGGGMKGGLVHGASERCLPEELSGRCG